MGHIEGKKYANWIAAEKRSEEENMPRVAQFVQQQHWPQQMFNAYRPEIQAVIERTEREYYAENDAAVIEERVTRYYENLNFRGEAGLENRMMAQERHERKVKEFVEKRYGPTPQPGQQVVPQPKATAVVTPQPTGSNPKGGCKPQTGGAGVVVVVPVYIPGQRPPANAEPPTGTLTGMIRVVDNSAGRSAGGAGAGRSGSRPRLLTYRDLTEGAARAAQLEQRLNAGGERQSRQGGQVPANSNGASANVRAGSRVQDPRDVETAWSGTDQ